MDRKSFNVLIVSPYLTGCAYEWLTNENIEVQMEQFGFDPDNLCGIKKISSEAYEVILHTPQWDGSGCCDAISTLDLERNMPDLIIAGATESVENGMLEYKKCDTGAIVARYSIFYGEPSRYTGRTADEAGYALDLPKSVQAVKELLSYVPILDVIKSRDLKKIIAATASLNKISQNDPVIVTSYMAEVCSSI